MNWHLHVGYFKPLAREDWASHLLPGDIVRVIDPRDGPRKNELQFGIIRLVAGDDKINVMFADGCGQSLHLAPEGYQIAQTPWRIT